MDNPRFVADRGANAINGQVRWAPVQSIWITSMTVIAIIGGSLTVSMSNVAVFLFTTALTLCCGHSLGMHRLFIHRSYATFKPVEYVLVWLGVLVGLAGPRGMMFTHDIRDWAQRQAHCHDYFGHRQAWYIDGWWQLHCRVVLDCPPRFTPEPAIENDPIYQWMERHWMAQQLIPAALLFALGGLPWVIWGVCARVSVSVFGHWLIGYFAHNQGGRDWHVRGAGVQGYNLRFLSLMTMGESWHNNHHAFPGSARLGLQQGQLDPGWWVLASAQKLGLVWDIKLAGDLAPREELEPVEHAPLRPVSCNGASNQQQSHW